MKIETAVTILHASAEDRWFAALVAGVLAGSLSPPTAAERAGVAGRGPGDDDDDDDDDDRSGGDVGNIDPDEDEGYDDDEDDDDEEPLQVRSVGLSGPARLSAVA